VYLGLGQSLRGKGLGRTLLPYCMARARSVVPGWPVTCAVDERNVPALRLYERLGFTVFGRRRALVRPV
jgi:ribosomal protein S18 acetylase RimI-like enzyme